MDVWLIGSSPHFIAATAMPALAAPKTVCTITVNSPDEKETFQRHLPPGEYRFVELVERGRPDWLASACQQRVSCDALIISGHFDGGEEFYTDRLDTSEYLSVEEMERSSCSESCPGVFSQLKEVYLFGCNTLKPEPRYNASAEIVRSLLRSGHSPADAARQSELLGERHGESNRDRMRNIFRLPSHPVNVVPSKRSSGAAPPRVCGGADATPVATRSAPRHSESRYTNPAWRCGFTSVYALETT